MMLAVFRRDRVALQFARLLADHMRRTFLDLAVTADENMDAAMLFAIVMFCR